MFYVVMQRDIKNVVKSLTNNFIANCLQYVTLKEL